jgi:phosphate-selective porin OprO/OprP
MDRGPYGDFGVDSYLLSVVGKVQGPNWSVTGAVQGDSINNADINNTSSATTPTTRTPTSAWASPAAATTRPIVTDTDKVHLAVSARYRNHGNEGAFNYQGRTGHQLRHQRPVLQDGRHRQPRHHLRRRRRLDPQQLLGPGRVLEHRRRAPGGHVPGFEPDRQGRLRLRQLLADGRDPQLRSGRRRIKRPKILNPITAGGFGGSNWPCATTTPT